MARFPSVTPSSLRSPIRGREPETDAKRIPVPLARAIVDCGVYVDGVRLPGKYTPNAALEKVRSLDRGFVWVGLHEPDEHQMEAVAQPFGLHRLAVEDAVHAHNRPKLERYDDTLFLILKTVNYVEHDSISSAREIVETGEIMIFVGGDFVVTVRHGDHSGLAKVRAQMDSDPDHMRLGPYAVMHAIADRVVDSYMEVSDLVETDIEAMEQNVFSPRSSTDIEHIYMLKREVVELRRAISPLTGALAKLTQDHNDLITKEVRRYLRDVLDHQTHAADKIGSYDELLTSLVNAALGKVAMQQNTDMRKISAWVGIAAFPTMLAGIYGMNFEHMPELAEPAAYPIVLLVMALVCTLLYRNFRKNGWL
ncbi:magnesium/cobalt transporter CorA [Mycobacteroides abscessus]|uniref:magnesium/cobalt transporter CorA n=1 Tax=Mycobacteroides abscessus TaxID=36809 RepID=UPI0009A78E79|nr:magnesium/cobalt transporter CorA [Mycobacteroides abscessus]SLG55967.1 Probable magnesium and cobalt transport transmembrane protein CorA [Mycobacteroides abscessus subsp. massiliense]